MLYKIKLSLGITRQGGHTHETGYKNMHTT
jgi:hypothetical protein